MFSDKILINLNEKIKKYSAIISYQKEEILKTEKLVQEFNEHILTQNEALKMFIEEETKLINLKNKYVNKRRAIKQNRIRNMLSKEDINNEQKRLSSSVKVVQKSKSVSCMTEMVVKIEEMKGPDRFYKAIYDMMTNNVEAIHIFRNHTFIPNKLKFIEIPRKMILCIIHEAQEISLKELIGHQLESNTYVHVVEGKVKIAYISNGVKIQTNYINTYHSYFISQLYTHNVCFSLIISDGPTIIGIDIEEKLSNEGYDTIPSRVEDSLLSSKDLFMNNHFSFECKQLSTQEIKNNLIFLDIKSALDDDKNSVPICVAAINYIGDIVVSKFLCPRRHISNYKTNIHDIDESDILGQEDSNDAIKKLQMLFKGKFLVGHDIYPTLSCLQIDLNTLAGIRDTQGCKALQNIMADGKKIWTLVEICNKLATIHQPLNKHSALEGVRAIRDVYLRIEKHWLDISSQELKNKVILTYRIKRASKSHLNCLQRSHQQYLVKMTNNSEIEEHESDKIRNESESFNDRLQRAYKKHLERKKNNQEKDKHESQSDNITKESFHIRLQKAYKQTLDRMKNSQDKEKRQTDQIGTESFQCNLQRNLPQSQNDGDKCELSSNQVKDNSESFHNRLKRMHQQYLKNKRNTNEKYASEPDLQKCQKIDRNNMKNTREKCVASIVKHVPGNNQQIAIKPHHDISLTVKVTKKSSSLTTAQRVKIYKNTDISNEEVTYDSPMKKRRTNSLQHSCPSTPTV